MSGLKSCEDCGEPIDVLRRPVRRLRWSRYWWHGWTSLLGNPLRYCPACGALYSFGGQLLGSAVVETAHELKARDFRDDMIGLRDGFGTIVVASGLTVGWTILGPVAYDVTVAIWAGAVGGISLLPFSFFAKKARKAKSELRQLRSARTKGLLPR